MSITLPFLPMAAASAFAIATLIVVLGLRRVQMSRSGNRTMYIAATAYSAVAALACLIVVAGYDGFFAGYAVYLGAISPMIWLILRNLATDSARYSALDEPVAPTRQA